MSMDAETIKKAVKRLEWHKNYTSEFLSWAETVIGRYRVWSHHEAGGQWFWELSGSLGNVDSEASEDEAKSAAQSDYEARIISALSSEFLSALDTQSSRTEALRKALEATIRKAFKSGFVRGQDAREADPDLNEWFDRWFTIYGAGIISKFEPLFTSNPGDADGWKAIEAESNQLRELCTMHRNIAAKLRKGLEWYANAEVFKASEHGIAFDRRDLSYVARDYLAEADAIASSALPTSPASSLREGGKS